MFIGKAGVSFDHYQWLFLLSPQAREIHNYGRSYSRPRRGGRGALAAQNGVRVDWMNETLGRIATKRRHLELLDKIQALEDELVELDHRKDEIS